MIPRLPFGEVIELACALSNVSQTTDSPVLWTEVPPVELLPPVAVSPPVARTPPVVLLPPDGPPPSEPPAPPVTIFEDAPPVAIPMPPVAVEPPEDAIRSGQLSNETIQPGVDNSRSKVDPP